MGKLAPKQQDTEEIPAVAPFTAEEIQISLDSWTRNLKTAQEKGDYVLQRGKLVLVEAPDARR